MEVRACVSHHGHISIIAAARCGVQATGRGRWHFICMHACMHMGVRGPSAPHTASHARMGQSIDVVAWWCSRHTLCYARSVRPSVQSISHRRPATQTSSPHRSEPARTTFAPHSKKEDRSQHKKHHSRRASGAVRQAGMEGGWQGPGGLVVDGGCCQEGQCMHGQRVGGSKMPCQVGP